MIARSPNLRARLTAEFKNHNEGQAARGVPQHKRPKTYGKG